MGEQLVKAVMDMGVANDVIRFGWQVLWAEREENSGRCKSG